MTGCCKLDMLGMEQTKSRIGPVDCLDEGRDMSLGRSEELALDTCLEPT